MRFSLQTVFAITLLVALMSLAWKSQHANELERARANQLQNEVDNLEQLLDVHHPETRDAWLHELEQYQAVLAMRDIALDRFEKLYDKYSTLKPRDGTTLSMRFLPTLPVQGGSNGFSYRIWVPEDRPVWLKFGVHPAKTSVNTSAEADALKFWSDSAYDPSGPFEMRLPAGDHRLRILNKAPTDVTRIIQFELDHESLLETSITAKKINGGSAGSIGGDDQIDFPGDQMLPWLLTLQTGIEGGWPDEDQKPAISVWLSDQPSQFQGFPGNDD